MSESWVEAFPQRFPVLALGTGKYCDIQLFILTGEKLNHDTGNDWDSKN